MACRFLNVSTSGYYEWVSLPPSPRAVADAALRTTIRRIHADSRETSGAPRVLAELRLGLGVHVGRKRVARLMRLDGLVGVSHRRKRRAWKPDTATHEDLVKRQFRADAPNRLWFCDITQHRARDGWVYCAAVIDAYSRRIVGWSISDRITAEIVVDALEMARWRRRPEPGTVVHADRGAQYQRSEFERMLKDSYGNTRARVLGLKVPANQGGSTVQRVTVPKARASVKVAQLSRVQIDQPAPAQAQRATGYNSPSWAPNFSLTRAWNNGSKGLLHE